jgi:arylsulfatase
VHLDGYNLLPYLTGQVAENPRKEFFYLNDAAELVAMRYDNWKIVFAEQRSPGTLALWAEPFVSLRVPKLFNLRMDPYERADITSNTYYDWMIDHMFIFVPAQAVVGQFLATFQEFPPSQKVGGISVNKAVEMLQQGGSSK